MRRRTILMLVLAAVLAFPQVARCKEKAEDAVARQEILLNVPGDWALQSKKPFMDVPDGIFNVSFQVHFFCTHTFKVQPGKKYSFYVETRSDDNVRNYVNAAFVVCSGLREMYHVMSYIPAPGDTLTQLAQPATEKQNFIIVRKNAAWLELYKKGYSAVAFNAKKDLSDLPNQKYSTKIQNVEDLGENLKVTFEKSIYEDFPAGTNVRLHRGNGFYQTIERIFPGKEWKQIGGKLELPANAEYFVPCVIYYGQKEQTVQLRNLRLVIE